MRDGVAEFDRVFVPLTVALPLGETEPDAVGVLEPVAALEKVAEPDPDWVPLPLTVTLGDVVYDDVCEGDEVRLAELEPVAVPEPVAARMSRSLPPSASGSTRDCTSVGRV